MINKIDEIVHSKTPRLNHPETYVLTQNRFNTYLNFNFTDLGKAQIYKVLYRDCSYLQFGIPMSFNYLNSFKPNEHTEYYYNKKPNDGNFVFENEDEKYVQIGESLVSFEIKYKTVNYSSSLGFNDNKYPFAYSEESIYFMLHRNYITIEGYKIQHKKFSMSICIKKMMS